MLLAGGPAVAAPLTFPAGQKLEAQCVPDSRETWTLYPVPGEGAWTPYQVSNGQTLVPTSFTIDSGEGLKSRHIFPGSDSITKPGTTPGSTTCHVNGMAYNDVGALVPFTATIVGNLVGKARVPTR